MEIAIGSDHGGYLLKEVIKKYLSGKGYPYKDFGCPSQERCDYPEYAFPVAEAVARKEKEKGILICKSGIGMCISANKVKGIRAALCHTKEQAQKSRQHNDANILVLAAEYTDLDTAIQITDAWLNTEYEGGRHKKRIDRITRYEA